MAVLQRRPGAALRSRQVDSRPHRSHRPISRSPSLACCHTAPTSVSSRFLRAADYSRSLTNAGRAPARPLAAAPGQRGVAARAARSSSWSPASTTALTALQPGDGGHRCGSPARLPGERGAPDLRRAAGPHGAFRTGASDALLVLLAAPVGLVLLVASAPRCQSAARASARRAAAIWPCEPRSAPTDGRLPSVRCLKDCCWRWWPPRLA